MNKDKHIPQGYKDSPLGIIPKEWEVKRLGDVCYISVGRDVQVDHFSEFMTDDYKYPVYSNTIEEKGLYGFYNYEEFTKGKVTVVGRGVGLGTSFARDNGFGAIGRLVVLTPRNNLSNHYLENYINSKVHFFVESAAIPQLTGEQIASYKIAIPPFPEQLLIENYIQLWDTAIEKQSELIEKLKLRKRALMQQLLTGKKRLPGFSGEWKIQRIKDHFTQIEDKNDSKGHVPMTISAKYGLVSQKDKFDRVVAGNSLEKYTLLRKGDFAYNKGNSNLYEMGCIYRLNEESAVVPFVYICFRAKDNTCCEFYKHFFINHGLDSQLKRIITSGARGDGLLNVNSEDFMSLKIPYPNIEEQVAIANVLNDADKEIELANKKLNNLQSQKRGLMQQLLTGKKRVI